MDQKGSATFMSGEYLLKTADELVNKKIKAYLDIDASGNKEAIANALSELLFATFILAERYGVELEESFLQSVNEIILGFVG